MKSLLASIVILVAAAEAHAQATVTLMPGNVQELMLSCQVANRIVTGQVAELSDDDGRKLVSCFSYTEGVIMGFLIGGNGSDAGPRFCLPHGTSIGQRAQVFALWAEQHPETWHSSAAAGFVSALQAQWPCGASH